jgi:hypothetical protein
VTTLIGSDPLAASLFDQSAQGLIVAQEHDAWSSAGDAAPLSASLPQSNILIGLIGMMINIG